MSETWFDTRNGELYIGRDAAAPFLDRNYTDDFEPELVPLADLLTAPNNEFPRERYIDPTPPRTREQLIEYGHWVMTILQKDGQPQPLRDRHLRRMRALGLGPSINAIYDTFESLVAFKEEIGSPFLNARGRFDHWTLSSYVSFARDLERRLGRKPETYDYTAAHLNDECPSLTTFYERVGSIGVLHEYLGHPNVPGWTNQDFIAWGVKALRANMASGIPPDLLKVLHKQECGPAPNIVHKRFGRYSEFLCQVEAALQAQLAEEAEVRAEKLDRYSYFLADGLLDSDYIDDEDTLLRAGAHLRLLGRLLPDVPEEQQRTIAQNSTDDFILAVLIANTELGRGRSRRSLNGGIIEATAAELGVYDDLWPEDISHLHVPWVIRYPYHLGDYQLKQLRKQRAASQ